MMSATQIQAVSTYSDRLKQLIPAEFIAAYLAIFNLINTSITEDALQTKVLIVVAIFLSIILPLYIYFIQGVKNWKDISISSISLAIWIISIGKILEVTTWYLPVYSSIAIILWTLVSPLLVSEK